MENLALAKYIAYTNRKMSMRGLKKLVADIPLVKNILPEIIATK
jgi:hypothetical protein